MGAAHSRKVYVKSTNAAPSAGDEVAGCTDFSLNRSRATKDTTAYKDDEYTRKTPLLIDASGSMELEEDLADAPQNLIRSSLLSGAIIYVTDLPDGTNGYTYPMIVTGYDAGGAVGDTRTASASYELNGTPIVRP